MNRFIRSLAALLFFWLVLMPSAARAQAAPDAFADPPPHPLIAKCLDRAKSDSYLLDCLQAGLRDLEIQWHTLEAQKNTPRADRLGFENARADECARAAADFVFENNKTIPAIPETKCLITRTQERIDALSLL
jgi:hypothetical protein